MTRAESFINTLDQGDSIFYNGFKYTNFGFIGYYVVFDDKTLQLLTRSELIKWLEKQLT